MAVSKRVHAHLRANVVGYIALFLVISGGTAYAVDGPLPGVNRVGSEDIINAEVQQPDIAQSAVNGARIANQSILDQDLAPGTVKGSKILDDSVTGDDVDESTLVGVDADQLDGQDSTDFLPSSTILARVLADGEQGWNPDGIAVNFAITDPSFDVAEALIVMNLDGDSNAPIATCAVSNLAFEAFVTSCTSPPPNGAELRYAIITP